MERKKGLIFVLVVTLLTITLLSGCGESKKEVKEIEELKIAASPGPASFPLAYMAENDVMKKVTDKFSIIPWSTGDQLKAMVTSQQANIALTPITNGLMLYNKGVDVKLINISVWGMLYVLSSDGDVQTLQDLAGQEIAVAGKGGIHDLILRHLLIENGLDPDKDVQITYMDLNEAATKLAMGQLKNALINEPKGTIAISGAKKNGIDVRRAIDLQVEWQKITGNKEAKIPQAGFVVVGENVNNKALIDEFLSQYSTASQWINDNGQASGDLVEKYFKFMKAPAVAASLEYARLEPVAAKDAQKEIENFFNELLKTASLEVIGGKLPDAEFYYQGN